MKSKPVIYKLLQDYLEDRTYEELLEEYRIIGEIIFRNVYRAGYCDHVEETDNV